jgi:hypothetical protein
MEMPMLRGAASSGATWSAAADAEEYHCDACWVVIPREERETFLESGLCDFCDARLNPYPRRPYQDDPRSPGSLIC